jgi:hypothetical protein
VAELRALLLVPVDPLLHGINVDERQRVRAGQQRRLPCQRDQELPAGLALLLTRPAPGGSGQRSIRTGTRPGDDPKRGG